MSADCIFCKIVRGELPSTKVYEDDEIISFMDIAPVVKGHTLVIPRRHYDPLINVPQDLLQKLILVVQRIAHAQVSGLKADGINVTQANGVLAGQVVPHVHFHVIPRFKDDIHSWHFKAEKYDSSEEMAGYAARISAAVRGG